MSETSMANRMLSAIPAVSLSLVAKRIWSLLTSSPTTEKKLIEVLMLRFRVNSRHSRLNLLLRCLRLLLLEIRIPVFKVRVHSRFKLRFGFSSFGFLSAFVIRHSSFLPLLQLPYKKRINRRLLPGRKPNIPKHLARLH